MKVISSFNFLPFSSLMYIFLFFISYIVFSWFPEFSTPGEPETSISAEIISHLLIETLLLKDVHDLFPVSTLCSKTLIFRLPFVLGIYWIPVFEISVSCYCNILLYTEISPSDKSESECFIGLFMKKTCTKRSLIFYKILADLLSNC